MSRSTTAIVPQSALATAPQDRQLLLDFESHDSPTLARAVPLDLSANSLEVLKQRYLRRDLNGNVAENAEQLFARVAKSVASAERTHAGPRDADRWSRLFFDSMASLDFLPNSPTLMNAGTDLRMLSACFVLPVEDSMDGIFGSLHVGANIHKLGGGTGYSFSSLRPAGDIVRSTRGVASGPVSFMRIFDAATQYVKQGGRRRGANMGVLSIHHPDIIEFVDAKRDGTSLQNFNLSVAATDEFFQAALAKTPYPLRSPRTGRVIATLPAAEVLQRIATNAWATGDPGMLFVDAINRANPTPDVGRIEATNPCGEVPLLPYEACVLGSVNLTNMVRKVGGQRDLDYDKLAATVHLGVRFLDDVIEVSTWPHSKTAQLVRNGNRKIGLGVMGFADALILLGIPYASADAVALAENLMQFIRREARRASGELAGQRGAFPNWQRSIYQPQGIRLRNATLTSVAPTGTIAIIAGCSPSIEPLFALAYRRENVLGGQTLTELNPLFVDYAKNHGFLTDALLKDLRNKGSLADISDIPDAAKRLFRTALEIPPTAHLSIQAAFQRHCCNAVSKTINLPESATPQEVAQIYLDAWSMGLKGVTVYRYGSKSQQVMNLGADVPTTPPQTGTCTRCAE